MPEHPAYKVVKMLREAGYIEDRIRGDHHIFVGPKGNAIPVAYANRKDNIPQGTYNKIMHSFNQYR